MKPNSFWRNSIKNNLRSSYLNNSVNFSSFIDFLSGENILARPQMITDAVKNIKLSDLQPVPDINCSELKKKISGVLNIVPETITVGNGSDEIIENISRVFLEPVDKIFTIVPTFFRFVDSSRRMKGEILTVATTEDEKFKFTERVITKTLDIIEKHNPKIIWLCSPNNPTGEVMELDQIETIVQKSKNLVVVDEAFQELVDPVNKKSAINLLKEHKHLLVLKTFSKTWGLGGVRFGFAVGSAAIINTLEKWRLPFNVNLITRKIILKLLDNWDYLKIIVKKTGEERKKLFDQINRIPGLEIGTESKINIFILKHKTKDIFQELLRRGILTADFRQASGLEGKGYVRITIKTRKENEILLKALREIN